MSPLPLRALSLHPLSMPPSFFTTDLPSLYGSTVEVELKADGRNTPVVADTVV